LQTNGTADTIPVSNFPGVPPSGKRSGRNTSRSGHCRLRGRSVSRFPAG